MVRSVLLVILVALAKAHIILAGTNGKGTKKCEGTNNRFSAPLGYAHNRYLYYRNRYSNCSVVEGNLEITHLDARDANFDMSFLNGIEEVTGYVLIAMNYVSDIPLNKLKVIKGHSLISIERQADNALFVALNYLPGSYSSRVGLRSLRLKALKEIRRGNVFIFDNKFLCDYPREESFWNIVLEKSDSAIYKAHDNCYRDELEINDLILEQLF